MAEMRKSREVDSDESASSHDEANKRWGTSMTDKAMVNQTAARCAKFTLPSACDVDSELPYYFVYHAMKVREAHRILRAQIAEDQRLIERSREIFQTEMIQFANAEVEFVHARRDAMCSGDMFALRRAENDYETAMLSLLDDREQQMFPTTMAANDDSR
jgi:hypothetical protein